jgi:hypothetical protein
MFDTDAQITLALALGGCSLFLTMLTLVWTCWTIYRLDRAMTYVSLGVSRRGRSPPRLIRTHREASPLDIPEGSTGGF